MKKSILAGVVAGIIVTIIWAIENSAKRVFINDYFYIGDPTSTILFFIIVYLSAFILVLLMGVITWFALKHFKKNEEIKKRHILVAAFITSLTGGILSLILSAILNVIIPLKISQTAAFYSALGIIAELPLNIFITTLAITVIAWIASKLYPHKFTTNNSNSKSNDTWNQVGENKNTHKSSSWDLGEKTSSSKSIASSTNDTHTANSLQDAWSNTGKKESRKQDVTW